MKTKTILWVIGIVILFNVIVFSFLLKNSEQTSLTGKFIDEGLQEQTQSSPQPEKDSQANNQQTNDYEQIEEEQNQEEEKCDGGYSGKRRCDGKVIEKEWISSDCSSKWFYYLKCYYDCKDGGCIDKPAQEPEETCNYGYSGKYRCNGKEIEAEWVRSDCSSRWFYHFECSYECKNGDCIYLRDKPIDDIERCEPKHSGKFKCDGNVKLMEYINLDCSSEWDYIFTCPEGCKDGKCIYDLDIKESDGIKVTYIVDGDTLDVDTGDRVRLICIDTPERGKYYYSEAKEYLKSLTLNKEVDLIKDISETDRYGRLLRYIYLEDGTFVNERIVYYGYGKAYPYNPDTSLCPEIQSAEQHAKDNNLGIWEETIEQETSTSSNIICSYNAYNCGDFSTCSEVMEVFNTCSYDIHYLDGDDDGIPCESLCG